MTRNFLFLAAAIAAAQNVAPPRAPSNLEVPAGHTAYLKAHATGTQNYVCLPDATGLAWQFQGPQATLFIKFQWFGGETRQQVTTHYLSPNPAESGAARATWLSSLDSSAVWARMTAQSSDPAFVAPGAIPWFLLQAVGTQPGPTGGTMLSRTTYMQRINTAGGVRPTGACPQPGVIQFVPYTADYVFYKAAN